MIYLVTLTYGKRKAKSTDSKKKTEARKNKFISLNVIIRAFNFKKSYSSQSLYIAEKSDLLDKVAIKDSNSDN